MNGTWEGRYCKRWSDSEGISHRENGFSLIEKPDRSWRQAGVWLDLRLSALSVAYVL